MDLPSDIRSDDDINKVAAHWIKLGRLSDAISQEEDFKAAQAVLAKALVRRKALADELEASKAIYEPLITAFAKKRLAGTRTYVAALMDVKFVACNAITIDVVDEAKALPYLRAYCPEAVVMKPTVKKAGFTTAFLALCSKLRKPSQARHGIKVIPPHDNVTLHLKAPGGAS